MPSDPIVPPRHPAPNWIGLLAIGLDRLRDVRTYGWYFAATAVLQLLAELAPNDGAVSIGIALAGAGLSVYVSLLLARQLMTGRLTTAPYDPTNLLRLLGLLIAATSALVIVLVIAAVFFGGLPPLPFLIGLVLAAFYLAARLAFYFPALALNDPISVRLALVLGRPFWARLLAVFITTGIAVSALSFAQPVLIPAPVRRLLSTVFGAAAALINTSAICYLYWKHARSDLPVSENRPRGPA
jgi:hypothetical protein